MIDQRKPTRQFGHARQQAPIRGVSFRPLAGRALQRSVAQPICLPKPPKPLLPRSIRSSRMPLRFYLKTKNFHWHVSSPHFRHQSFAARRSARANFCDDGCPGRAGRKIGGTTLRSTGPIAGLQRIKTWPRNQNDVTTSRLENFIDETKSGPGFCSRRASLPISQAISTSLR